MSSREVAESRRIEVGSGMVRSVRSTTKFTNSPEELVAFPSTKLPSKAVMEEVFEVSQLERLRPLDCRTSKKSSIPVAWVQMNALTVDVSSIDWPRMIEASLFVAIAFDQSLESEPSETKLEFCDHLTAMVFWF